jgi:magnesium-transporting ATPase (P-type)
MNENREKGRIGIASMLEKTEIKDYFDTLFILVLGIEFVIFVAHFIGSIGPDKGIFPWKQYFFVSFITPIVLVFLIGLVIIGFNYYIFGNDYTGDVPDTEDGEGKEKNLRHTTRNVLRFLNQMPVLVGLFSIGLGSVVLYKLDTILKVIGHVGERTAFYLFIMFAVIVAGALIFLLLWMFWKFRLHKLEIERRWEFKNRVMERSGLIILENNMVLDDQGKVLTQAEAQVRIDAPQVEDDHKKLPFIPRNFMMK